MISPKLNDKPPLNAKENPISLILSRNSAVSGTLVFLRILPIIPRRAFLLRTLLIYPAFSGTTSLNRTLPTVVSISLVSNSPESFKSLTLTLIAAFKSTLFSLKAMLTSSDE